MEEKSLSDLSIHISEGCLVVPIQGEIDDERMSKIQCQILKGVEDSKVKGVVIDLSGVRIIEPYHAGIIDKTAKMISLLGAKTVLTGIKPGVAIALTDSNFDFKEIYETAGTFEEGVKKLQPLVRVEEKSEEAEEEVEKNEVIEEVDTGEETGDGEDGNVEDEEDFLAEQDEKDID
ncbi:STAS domain-containing protein [candidate division WOR-3 bacterium]|nr:STAS domain-containing protein [candidate division WOR-3 bacterium]